MAQTRFFQHLNENDNLTFQKVTTLDCIDNSGGMIMYYFKDGSKCSKTYIAPVNANSVDGFEFAEVSDPKNIWKLKKIVPEQEKVRTAVGSDGQIYQAPTWEDYTQSQVTSRKTRVEVIGHPIKIENYVAPSDSDYYFNPDDVITKTETKKSGVVTNENFDFNSSANTTDKKLASNQDIYDVKTSNLKISQPALSYQFMSIENGILHLDAKKLLENIKSVNIHFNGEACELPTSDFIENAITPKEEKEVVKEVVKEIQVSSEDIDLEIDETQKGLINNMIDMSNKTEYSIDMELTLNLPPADVYKLIKNVYPAGMSKGFVNIIANRMQVKELKSAVADGLMAFYDGGMNEGVNVEEESEDKTIGSPKKSGRSKTTNK